MAVTTNGSIVKMTAAGDKVSDAGFGRIRVKTVTWDGMASGNDCVLNEGSGGIALMANEATADDDSFELVVDGWLSDIYVTTLNGGVVTVYLD